MTPEYWLEGLTQGPSLSRGSLDKGKELQARDRGQAGAGTRSSESHLQVTQCLLLTLALTSRPFCQPRMCVGMSPHPASPGSLEAGSPEARLASFRILFPLHTVLSWLLCSLQSAPACLGLSHITATAVAQGPNHAVPEQVARLGAKETLKCVQQGPEFLGSHKIIQRL